MKAYWFPPVASLLVALTVVQGLFGGASFAAVGAGVVLGWVVLAWASRRHERERLGYRARFGGR